MSQRLLSDCIEPSLADFFRYSAALLSVDWITDDVTEDNNYNYNYLMVVIYLTVKHC